MELFDPELLWAIGLFEGEGTIGVYPERHQIYLCMHSTDLDVLERFQRIVGGGSIYKESRKQREAKGHKPCWRWQSTRNSVSEGILRSFLPFLGVRRTERALEALVEYEQRRGKDPWTLRRERYGPTGRRKNVLA